MKKNVLLLASIIALSIVGCSSNKETDLEVSTEKGSAVETDAVSGKEIAGDESKEEDFTYQFRSDGDIEIDGYNGSASRIIIPEEIDGYKVVAISGFKGNKDITYVSIPASVKSIGLKAFYDCSSLTQVDMTDGLEEIGELAFSSCDNLKEFNMPDTVTVLGEAALRSSGVESIHISAGLDTLSDYCFSVCESLEGSITIPSNIKVISDYAFGHDSSLTEVVIEDGATSIGTEAFGECEKLAKVVVPSSVTEITAGFRGSKNVTLDVASGSYAESYAEENGVKYEVH